MGGTTSLANSNLPVLMVYGTLDDEHVNLVASSKPFLPEHTAWVAIEGGNRAQFANFGPMPADIVATISSESHQRMGEGNGETSVEQGFNGSDYPWRAHSTGILAYHSVQPTRPLLDLRHARAVGPSTKGIGHHPQADRCNG